MIVYRSFYNKFLLDGIWKELTRPTFLPRTPSYVTLTLHPGRRLWLYSDSGQFGVESVQVVMKMLNGGGTMGTPLRLYNAHRLSLTAPPNWVVVEVLSYRRLSQDMRQSRHRYTHLESLRTRTLWNRSRWRETDARFPESGNLVRNSIGSMNVIW